MRSGPWDNTLYSYCIHIQKSITEPPLGVQLGLKEALGGAGRAEGGPRSSFKVVAQIVRIKDHDETTGT